MIRSSDYSYVNEDAINPFLKCKFCSKPYVDPVITIAGSRSCRSCISPDNQHQSVTPVPEKLVLTMLDDLRVNCIKCKETNIRRGDFDQHYTTTCPQRILSCKAADLKCSWTGIYEQLNDHLQSCPFELLRPILAELLVNTRQNQNRILSDEQQTNECRMENKELEQWSILKAEYKIECDAFKKEVEELRQQHYRLQSDIQQIRSQSERMEKENSLLKEELNRTAQYQKQLEGLKQLYSRHIHLNNALQIDIQQLKNQFHQQNTFWNELQTELNQYKRSINSNHEIQQLKEQSEQLQIKLQQLSEQIINPNTQQSQDQIKDMKQLFNQHDVQIKLLARKKCVIPAMNASADVELEKLIENSLNNLEIDLDDKQLIDRDMDVIYKKVINEKKCQKLRLQNNKITGKGATLLANALYNNTILTELYLSKNQISDTGVHALAQTLAINNSTLKLLDLQSNNITDEGVEYLAEMLKINKTIVRLELGFNQISDQGVQLLANAMTYYNEKLQWLSLSSNKLIGDRSVASLVEILTRSPSLKTLRLNDCNLSKNAVAQLKQERTMNENFHLEV